MQKYVPHLLPTKAIIALLILIVLIPLSACDSPQAEETVTPTLTATQTETPTATIDWFPATPTSTLVPLPSPTPRPTLEDMRTGITGLLINDDFTDQNLWTTRQSSVGNIAFGVQNLSLAIASPNTSLTSLSQHNLPEDFYLEITLQPTLCQPADQIGIIFWRQSEGDYHRVLLDCSGQIRLELFQDGQSFVLEDWKYATSFQPGAPATNRLGLWVANGQFQIYVNDAFQFTRSIASNRSGALGVFARTISGNTMTVRVSDLQIYQVEPD